MGSGVGVPGRYVGLKVGIVLIVVYIVLLLEVIAIAVSPALEMDADVQNVSDVVDTEDVDVAHDVP